MSRQKTTNKIEEKKWYRDMNNEDNNKISPVTVIAGVGYIILSASALIAFIYYANKNLQ